MSEITNILVANRGEIALRIMRSARLLGMRTVAVYSTADAESAHARAADLAVHIGDSAPAQSYLNIAAIIAAAHASGADAVHPGYGFLAENADFARACRDAGLNFIGPSDAAISAMGDKANAKILMRRAGVPCVPGYDGERQDVAALRKAAAEVGYPVMIKASAGGGGRGMRIVAAPEKFDAALESAKSEALHAFGSDHVILERVIANPRHIEIQVVADRHGRVIHLGERDCSVQRRHQKIIEEAPGVGITPQLRAAMGEAAVRAASAIGYEGVGTLEFLLDADKQFYFMEMNTRLQVEHPVTEAVTGMDLVAMQINIACGRPLGLTQDQVAISGHAIEVRLCAEDESQNFMPQSGVFSRWIPPQGVRVETAVCAGAVMSPFYDSMFAKIIAHGADREEARRRLCAALDQTVVFGVKTNKALLGRCLAHPVFIRGGVGTGFLESYRRDLQRPDGAGPHQAAALAAALLYAHDSRGHGPGGAASLPSLMHLADTAGGLPIAARVRQSAAGNLEVEIGGVLHTVQVVLHETGSALHTAGGVARRVFYDRSAAGIELQLDGDTCSFVDVTYAAAVQAADDASTDGRVRASMNGRVAALFAAPGAAVRKGEVLVTVEAMKMEHQHCAPVDGVIADVAVGVGDLISRGRLMIELKPGTTPAS